MLGASSDVLGKVASCQGRGLWKGLGTREISQKASTSSTPNPHYLPLLSLFTLHLFPEFPLNLLFGPRQKLAPLGSFLEPLSKRVQRFRPQRLLSPDPEPLGPRWSPRKRKAVCWPLQFHKLDGKQICVRQDDREPPFHNFAGEPEPKSLVQDPRKNTELIGIFFFLFLRSQKTPKTPCITYKCKSQSRHSNTHLWLY